MVVEIREVERVDAQLVEGFGRLIPQLSSTSRSPTAEELQRLLESDTTVLFAAWEDGTIVGALTLVVARLPTGIRARIEDVVVDEAFRGRGVAAELSQAALRRAAAEGAKTVDLTSRPDRTAANRLYERLRFEKRDTNVYRLRLSGE
ncbi:MAG: GNAT family N-acetyltransferase [Gammaproteobacteria bacterium]|nr:GNAT family N-acetyltransferase [Gammaproteobacteria bacterium]